MYLDVFFTEPNTPLKDNSRPSQEMTEVLVHFCKLLYTPCESPYANPTPSLHYNPESPDLTEEQITKYYIELFDDLFPFGPT
jgi:hypothetical protein